MGATLDDYVPGVRKCGVPRPIVLNAVGSVGADILAVANNCDQYVVDGLAAAGLKPIFKKDSKGNRLVLGAVQFVIPNSGGTSGATTATVTLNGTVIATGSFAYGTTTLVQTVDLRNGDAGLSCREGDTIALNITAVPGSAVPQNLKAVIEAHIVAVDA